MIIYTISTLPWTKSPFGHKHMLQERAEKFNRLLHFIEKVLVATTIDDCQTRSIPFPVSTFLKMITFNYHFRYHFRKWKYLKVIILRKLLTGFAYKKLHQDKCYKVALPEAHRCLEWRSRTLVSVGTSFLGRRVFTRVDPTCLRCSIIKQISTGRFELIYKLRNVYAKDKSTEHLCTSFLVDPTKCSWSNLSSLYHTTRAHYIIFKIFMN